MTDTLYAVQLAEVSHYGVRGMRWGTRRFNKRMKRVNRLAEKADKSQALSDKVEGTHGSQFRRFVSRPIQARANRLGNMSDKAAQLAYLKASRKLTKLRQRAKGQDTQTSKIDSLHAELQKKLQVSGEARQKTATRIREHQMRQLNDIYGGYSKGAKLNVALGELDGNTKNKIKRLSDAIDIATAIAPVGKAARAAKLGVEYTPKAKKMLEVANRVADGKSPINPIDKKQLAINVGKKVTGRAKIDAVGSKPVRKKKKSK